MRILFKIFQQYLISFFNNLHKKRPTQCRILKEWAEVDSDHRSIAAIYSLSPCHSESALHQNANHSDNSELELILSVTSLFFF